MRFSVSGNPVGRLLAVAAGLLATAFTPLPVTANTVLRMQTDLGGIDIELFDGDTPKTVGNFMDYVNDGDYEGTFIHRSARLEDGTPFVLQMGGFLFDPLLGAFTDNSGITHIPTESPVDNEPGLSNVRGTIAMAKLAGDPNSATSEFFFNLGDNCAILDSQNGGFTVFGKVLGEGMEIIDSIAALDRCMDIIPLSPNPCNVFSETPLVGMEAPNGAIFSSTIQQFNLVHLVNIGTDIDGDGIIDKVEDAAPNNGDADNDRFRDSEQAGTASFSISSGEYVVAETENGVSLSSTDVLGLAFLLTTIDPADPNNPIADLVFPLQAGFGTTLSGNAQGGSTTLTITLPSGKLPNGYFNYGPEGGDPSLHWYEFLFDGDTGAEINGNLVTLHLVDGKRGDSDLVADGVITLSRGAPVVIPGDADGVPDAIEDGAPNHGDANNDRILDSTQDNVVSFPNSINGSYITLVTASPLLFGSVTNQTSILFANPSKVIQGLNFPDGLFGFSVTRPNPNDAGAIAVEVILQEGTSPTTYYKYGPTSDNPDDHWYEFLYDGKTGAEFKGNVVMLHLVDGMRGDSDLIVNGTIVDPGAPAQQADISGASGGGGCSLAGHARNPAQADAWWLVFTLMVLLRLRPAVSSRL